MSSLRRFLRTHRKIGIDTSIFIYHLEASSALSDLAREVFTWLEQSGNTAVTSTLTMTELLVQPYRANNLSLVDQYYGLLSTYPNLSWMAPDLRVADTAAGLRARHRLRTPDALQIATAIHADAPAFLTNDADLKRVSEIHVALLLELR